MQTDVVLHRGNSIIQHGHHNNRVYVMKLAPKDIPDIIRFADDLCLQEGYSKIFVKVPASSVDQFLDNGYVPEATVPFFFRGKEPAIFMVKYGKPDRSIIHDSTILADVLSASLINASMASHAVLPDGYFLEPAKDRDAEEITALYRAVFKTYPFPVFDPEYIRETMQGSIRYFIVRVPGRQLAAVASCEVNTAQGHAEMTDFATGPGFRGYGLASNLLRAMETCLQGEGILLAYTIARAISRPINTLFAAAGYQYGGLLANNTNICGNLESMNVWYKKL